MNKFLTSILSLLLCIFFSIPLLAEQGIESSRINDPVHAGSLVYLDSAEPLTVLLDGKELGSTPLLLSGLQTGTHTIEFRGAEFGITRQIMVTANIKEPLVISLLPDDLTGTLHIGSDPEGATVFIDGIAAGTSPLELSSIPHGNHEIVLESETMRFGPETVSVIPGQVTSRRYILEPLVPVLFEPILPADARIIISNQSNEEIVNTVATKSLMLIPGEFTLRIETPGKGSHEESLVIETTPKVVSTDVLLGSAVVTMSEIRTGVIVTIDGKITPKNELYGGVGVSAGSHLLSFHTQNGESMLLPIVVEEDATLDITPSLISFLRTPRLDGKLTAYQRSRSPVIPILSAITLAGGIILNLDTVAGAIGRTYDGYSTVKYVSLGLMGTSVVALSISSLVLLLQGD